MGRKIRTDVGVVYIDMGRRAIVLRHEVGWGSVFRGDGGIERRCGDNGFVLTDNGHGAGSASRVGPRCVNPFNKENLSTPDSRQRPIPIARVGTSAKANG